jgi:CRP/FNR family transcriptional regulator, cyclic AMP receptor protein
MNNHYGRPIVDNCPVSKLRSQSFFCNLPSSTLEAFERIEHANSYPEGAVLFVERQKPRGRLHALCRSGQALGDRRAGRTIILRIAKLGESLGLHATVSNQLDGENAAAVTAQPRQRHPFHEPPA